VRGFCRVGEPAGAPRIPERVQRRRLLPGTVFADLFDARVTGAVLRPVKATRYAGVLRAAMTGLSRRFWDGCREMG